MKQCPAAGERYQPPPPHPQRVICKSPKGSSGLFPSFGEADCVRKGLLGAMLLPFSPWQAFGHDLTGSESNSSFFGEKLSQPRAQVLLRIYSIN